MKRIKRSVLVAHSATRMYGLVWDVDRYCTFLPWCGGSKILKATKDTLVARIDIDFHGVKAHFTTRNTGEPDKAIVVTLVDGPFRELHGEWRFRSLAKDACKVEFELAYEFANPVLEAAVGPVFDRIASTFVEAFVSRADAQSGTA
jgi:ribosome-associated toxin RatA of RatAB toxin-antitoxin module